MTSQGHLFGAERVPVKRNGQVRTILAFLGPAYLVSVGYMDPGNWATDIEAGSRFGYMLLWILVLSNVMAIVLQTLASRLGIVTGLDLAQACRREYPPWITVGLWVLAEIAIAACDLAEALGTIIGLNLLFGLPLLWGCFVTAFDTFLFLALERLGVRKIEAFILVLVATIGVCFLIEMVLVRPELGGIAAGLVPRIDSSALLVAIGIIGATVMPHNLYLHSALVQTRAVAETTVSKRDASRYNLIDSTIALNAAFFVNAAILILAAATFHVRGVEVTEIQQAHALLEGLLGTNLAPVVFAVALLAAGQSSTITGTLAGQVVMEGFVNLKINPALRRFVTRVIALIPAVIAIALLGDNGVYRLLILSQVVLSLQLPFAVIPLITFTSKRSVMGVFTNGRVLRSAAWCIALVIVGLNLWLGATTIASWTEGLPFWAGAVVLLCVLALLALLAAVTFPGFFKIRKTWDTGISTESAEVASAIRMPVVRHIGVAVEHTVGDATVVSAAIAQARAQRARITLLHIVDTPGTSWQSDDSASLHSAEDETYLRQLAREVEGYDVEVDTWIGYGRASVEIVRAADSCKFDMLVVGSHGHKSIGDLVYGHTVDKIRHALPIPILVIRSGKNEERAMRAGENG